METAGSSMDATATRARQAAITCSLRLSGTGFTKYGVFARRMLKTPKTAAAALRPIISIGTGVIPPTPR